MYFYFFTFNYFTITHVIYRCGVGHTNPHKWYTNDGVHKAADFSYHVGWGDDLTCTYTSRELHARLQFNNVLFEFRLSAIHIPHDFPHTPNTYV